MSRKAEIGQSVLHRYYNAQAPTLERPKNVRSVESVSEAQRFRTLCVNDISMRITRIHDPLLTDYQIRDLNDELNKLMKEKTAWEFRIKDLGGPDYLSYSKANQGAAYEKDSLGYRYFGRARELPDVKMLLEAKKREINEARLAKEIAKSDKDFMQKMAEAETTISPEYYSFFDESAIQDENLDQAVQNDTSTEEVITEEDIRHMNAKYFEAFGDHEDPIVAYEKSRTKELLQEAKPAKPGPNRLVHFDESILIPDDAVEKKLVELRKAALQNRL